MTVSASSPAWAPLQVPPICRVFVSSTQATSADGKKEVWRESDRDLAKTEWVHDPRLVVQSWRLESGATPHSCSVVVPGNDDDGKPLVSNFGLVWGVDQTNQGEELGVVMRPRGIYWFDDVMIIAYAHDDASQDESVGTVVFRGVVSDVWEDLETGLPGFTAMGPRFLMEGSRVHGANVWDERNKNYVWVPEVLPVFNAGGEADMADDEDVSGSTSTLQPAFTHVGGAGRVHFSRGHVWNYLRHHWQVNPKSSVVLPLSGWLNVLELSENGTGSGLFTVPGDSEETYENKRLSMALHGKRLNTAFAALARHGGDHDITVRPDAEVSTLLLYGTGVNTIESTQRRLTLRRGEISKKITASVATGGQPEICGGQLGYSVRNSYTRLRMYGARKELDLTVDTAAGSLAEGWLSGNQSTYNGAARDNDDAEVTPSVYRRYVLPDNVDWIEEYGFMIHLLRSGALGATLNSADEATAEASGRAVRVRAQAWYSTDDGSTWSDVKSSFTVQTKNLAVMFPHCARYGDKTRFTWNGSRSSPVSYDIRLTIKVVLDERLMVEVGSEPDGWPAREMIRLDDNYKYHARRNCRIRTDNGNPPDAESEPGTVVLDGGTMCDPAAGILADDVIRDDTSYMQAAARSLHSQLARTRLEGEIVLRGVRVDIFPGDYIEKITGGGGAGKAGVKRADWPVHAVVRGVRVDASPGAQTTTLALEPD